MIGRIGYNNNNLKYRNRGIVLQWIANSPISRAEITKKMELSRMAITNIVGELIDDGYIKEGESSGISHIGRKPILLDIAPRSPLAAGIYIARNSIFSILTDIRLTALYIDEVPLQNETEQSLKKKTTDILDRLFSYHKRKMPDRRILGIGVSSIGPFDPVNAEILNPRDFFNISNLPLRKLLEERYNLPVYAENDMNASAFAEYLKGKGKSCNSFMYLGITNGIGAGIIVDRHIYGKNSFSVGEIGHMSINYDGPVCVCGNRGCLEAYATIPTVISRLKAATGKTDIEITDFEALADIPECHQIFKDVCDKLSVALVNSVNILDPECIIIGHEGSFIPEQYLKYMQKQVESRILSSGYKQVPIYHSAFNLGAPLYGSAAIILNRLFSGENL